MIRKALSVLITVLLIVTSLGVNVKTAQAEGQGVITGKVTDPEGKPLAGIEVRARTSDTRQWINTVQTDVNGMYSLNLSPGTYNLCFETYRYNGINNTDLSYQWYPGLNSSQNAQVFEISQGGTISDTNVQLQNGGRISGTVRDTDGNLLSGIRVYISIDGYSSYNTTNSQGHYEFRGRPVGNHTIFFDPGEYNLINHKALETAWYSKETSGTSSEVSVTAGSSVTGIDGSLTIVNGSVNNLVGEAPSNSKISLSWAPTPGATDYVIYRSTSPYRYYSEVGRTSANSYEDTAVNPSTSYWYTVSAITLSGEGEKSASIMIRTPSITSGGGGGSQPVGTGSIAGKITGPDEKGLSHVTVRLKRDNNYIKDIETDENGNYQFGALSPGTYLVFVSTGNYNEINGTNYAYGYYHTGQNWADSIMLVEGQTLSGLNIELSQGAEIRGQVTDQEGTPMDGIHVYAVSDEVTASGLNTDGNGTFVFKGLPASEFKIVADPARYNSRYDVAYQERWYPNSDSRVNAQGITVHAGDLIEGININLSLSSTNSVQGLKASSLGNDSITLTWDSVTGATTYRIYRALIGYGTYESIAYVPSTQFTDSNLILNKEYWYKVSPVIGSVEEELSAPISVVTGQGVPLEITWPTTENQEYTFRGINVEFNKDIIAPSDWSGISVLDSDGNKIEINKVRTTISQSELQISSSVIIPDKIYTLVIAPNTITSTTGEEYTKEIRLTFKYTEPQEFYIKSELSNDKIYTFPGANINFSHDIVVPSDLSGVQLLDSGANPVPIDRVSTTIYPSELQIYSEAIQIGQSYMLIIAPNTISDTAGTLYPNEIGFTFTYQKDGLGSLGHFATPVIQLGSEAEKGTGIYIGFNAIKDSQGNTIANGKISSYLIEIDYDPQQTIFGDAINKANFELFDKNVVTDEKKVYLIGGNRIGMTDIDELVFIPIQLIGPSGNKSNLTIRFKDLIDENLNPISADPVNIQLQRGKVINASIDTPINVTDVVAGLQYLASIRQKGLEVGNVNIINMASIHSSTTNAQEQADVKDVIALMQYLVHLRDDSFNQK